MFLIKYHYFQCSIYLFNFSFSFGLFVSVTKFLLIHLFVKSIKKLDWCFVQIISLPWSLFYFVLVSSFNFTNIAKPFYTQWWPCKQYTDQHHLWTNISCIQKYLSVTTLNIKITNLMFLKFFLMLFDNFLVYFGSSMLCWENIRNDVCWPDPGL